MTLLTMPSILKSYTGSIKTVLGMEILSLNMGSPGLLVSFDSYSSFNHSSLESLVITILILIQASTMSV